LRKHNVNPKKNVEIEARFLEVDLKELVGTLHSLGATNKGEELLSEIIFYDQEGTWKSQGRYARLRSKDSRTTLTYKKNTAQTIDSAFEVEFEVSSMDQATLFLENVGLKAWRFQEKRRHTFILDSVIIDIDTWPTIPTYVELEAVSEEKIRSVARQLGFKWSDVVFDDARKIIEERYSIPVGSLTYFTFDKIE